MGQSILATVAIQTPRNSLGISGREWETVAKEAAGAFSPGIGVVAVEVEAGPSLFEAMGSNCWAGLATQKKRQSRKGEVNLSASFIAELKRRKRF
jgi:hypothetical protein